MEERVPKQGKWPNLPPGNRPQEELARFSTARLEESWPLFTDSVPGTSRRTFGHPIRSKSNRLTRSGISNFRETRPVPKFRSYFAPTKALQYPMNAPQFACRTGFPLVSHSHNWDTVFSSFRQNKVRVPGFPDQARDFTSRPPRSSFFAGPRLKLGIGWLLFGGARLWL